MNEKDKKLAEIIAELQKFNCMGRIRCDINLMAVMCRNCMLIHDFQRMTQRNAKTIVENCENWVTDHEGYKYACNGKRGERDGKCDRCRWLIGWAGV